MCGATMRSVVQPGHTHTCGMAHTEGDHKCSDASCRRWSCNSVALPGHHRKGMPWFHAKGK